MKVTLYGVVASHPTRAVELMLARKGIDFRRRDLPNVIARGMLRAMRFPGVTVPAMRIDGRRVQGSREIARVLEAVQLEPPLFPADPAARTAVEQAERWGDEDFQAPARRIMWNAIRRDRQAAGSYLEGAKLGMPIWLAARTSAPLIVMSARVHRATDENVRADLAALPGMLQRIDDWIAEGVLGGPEPNAADFQISATVRMLMTLDDVRPAIESRPAGELALRVVPSYPGHAPPLLPPAWLGPLRESAQVAAG
jgi:glutathione S-transferase